MSWSTRAESGGSGLVRVAGFLALHGGRAVGPLLTGTATAWFLLLAGGARRASADYLRRALGRPPSLLEVARHFHSFATVVLDRVLLLGGREERFDIGVEGLDTVLDILARGEGCILLGAHLGSFEVLRSIARHAPVPVWALMYRDNAGALTRLLDRLAPALRAHIIPIGDTASMLRARECVERGEIVGILADRAPPGHRMVSVPFLGAEAAFPSGPFVLAATLAAPLVLFHAVRTGPRRYRIRFEPFADAVVLRRSSRAADLRQVVARYATALEGACRAHPFQWFNFFPFWEPTRHAEPDPAHRAAAAAAPAALSSGPSG